MTKGKLKIATCQFAVSDSIVKNSETIQQQMNLAAKKGADIVHFSETALSGYGGHEVYDFSKFDWENLRKHTENIMALAKQLGLWVVLGSTHKLTLPNKPHNSLYLIDPDGKIQDRYDKRFLTTGDLEYYSSGDHFVEFEINGIKCGLLICFDLRFPEIYRQLYKRGVQVIFQSFYNARQPGPSVHTHIMRQTMQCRAATNFMWVSLSNSCRYYSPYPSCFISPEGEILHQLDFNQPGLMVNTVDISKQFYDPMKGFREMAMAGKLSNKEPIKNDPRSENRNQL